MLSSAINPVGNRIFMPLNTFRSDRCGTNQIQKRGTERAVPVRSFQVAVAGPFSPRPSRPVNFNEEISSRWAQNPICRWLHRTGLHEPTTQWACPFASEAFFFPLQYIYRFWEPSRRFLNRVFIVVSTTGYLGFGFFLYLFFSFLSVFLCFFHNFKEFIKSSAFQILFKISNLLTYLKMIRILISCSRLFEKCSEFQCFVHVLSILFIF